MYLGAGRAHDRFVEVSSDNHLQGREALSKNLSLKIQTSLLLSSAYPVSTHKCAITAAQLVQWRSLPRNQEAVLADSSDDLQRMNLSGSFYHQAQKWKKGTLIYSTAKRCCNWSLLESW